MNSVPIEIVYEFRTNRNSVPTEIPHARLVSKDTCFCRGNRNIEAAQTEATAQQPRCCGLCSGNICVSCGRGRCGQNTCSLGLDVANLTGVVVARVGFEELSSRPQISTSDEQAVFFAVLPRGQTLVTSIEPAGVAAQADVIN